MFDTLEEVERRASAGKDSLAEFKEVVFGKHGVRSPNTDQFAAEMVAFANSDGGVIFMGVDDDGIVCGLPISRLAEVERWAINVAINNCAPPIHPILRTEYLRRPDDSEAVVLLVEIRPGLTVHATLDGRHYQRLGSSKQILAGPRLVRLFQDRERAFVFDQQGILTATRDDLDFSRLKHFFNGGPTGISWSDLLLNTGVVVTDEYGTERPTVAGVLAFGKAPRRHLPSAYIEAAVYSDTRLTSDDLVHSESIEGRVDDQIDDAIAFVWRFMLKPARKPIGREDHPQYDIGAVLEAIVNAVAHRDYSITGSKIRLFLYADRLEIYSPGALPSTLTIDTMAYRVFTRNQLLVTFLSQMGNRRTGHAFLESRGEGVRKILDASEAHAGRRPVYELFGSDLRLTIWAKSSPNDTTLSGEAG